MGRTVPCCEPLRWAAAARRVAAGGGVRPGDGTPLMAGDGAAVSQETMLQIHATTAVELLLFDLA